MQQEVRDGLLQVMKIPGTCNPADLMTKILTTKEIEDRLEMMNIGVRYVRGRSRTQSISTVSRKGQATILQELEEQRKQIDNRIRSCLLEVRRSGRLGLEKDRQPGLVRTDDGSWKSGLVTDF